MAYKPPRQESENAIRSLADRYPKCFFEDPKLRRPLKHDIIKDLQADGAPLALVLLTAAIEWYQSHFAYLYSLQPGAKRIDLDGNEVGTVTELEWMVAERKIKAGRQKKSAIGTISTLYAAGRISDDQVQKLDAPMKPKTAETPIAPQLARLYEAIMAASRELTASSDSDLRFAMATAALGVVCKEAQRVIDSLIAEREASGDHG
jgi:sRNA-binding protein